MTPAQAPREPFRAVRPLKDHAALLGLALVVASPATQAAITFVADAALTSGGGFLITNIRRLTLRVGSTSGTIDNVILNVTGANVSPSPGVLTGIPSAVTGSQPNSVRISVAHRWTNFLGVQNVIVSANSSAGLSCISGPCGSTVIPFSSISWTAFSLAGAPYAGQDFVSGSFSNSASQTLVNFNTPAQRSATIENDWVFTYANTVLYPAGSYRGRVTFTAFMP